MGSDCVSMPVLYKANETNFQHLGLGVLAETTEALVTEERNGQFFLDLKYPIDGMLFNELKNDRLIKADASNDLKQQRFKIVRITKPSKGIVSVYAEHVSLHTQEMQLKPKVEYSGNAQMALNTWKDNIVDEHPFTVFSDIEHEASGKWTIEKVDSARRALGGVAGSLLDSYGGEYRFDNYHIGLYQARGNDNGALIAYGKNLTDLEQDEQIANTYTSVYPFSVLTNEEDETEEMITLPEYFVDSEHVDKYARRKILLVDFSEEEINNVETLRSRTKTYINSNNIGVPSVNLKVKFMDLAKTLDYKHLKLIEEINLCDWVNVYFEKLDVRQKAKVIKTIWNVLLDRYEEIELGDSRASLTKRIENTVDGKLETVIARMNTIQLSANGKTKIYRGPDMPTGGTNGDVWYKPVGNGEVEMYLHDGVQWNFEEISATSLAGTINFSKLNVIDFIADNITGGRLNLANDLTISNGDTDVIYIDPQSGRAVANFSSLQLNFEEVATQKDLEEIELTPGESGKTAYELAVENGFVGTESEWLESLKGPQGPTGSTGPTGATGRGVGSLQTEYYLSESKTSRIGGSWSTNQPTWEKGKYVWTRIRINLTNPSGVDYTEPSVDASWEAIDGIEIGGRNLLRNSDIEVSAEGGREFIQFADLAPIFDEHGTDRVYSLSLELKSADTSINNKIQIYMQNGSATKYGFINKTVVVTEEYQRFVFEGLTPTLNSNTETNAMLAFYGTYDTGNFPIIRKVKVEFGNKATTYSEAPEDVEDSINSKADTTTVDEINENLSNLETVTATREELGEVLSTLNDYKDMIEANEIDVNDARTSISDLLGRVPLLEKNLSEWVEQWNFLDTYVRLGDEGLLIQEKTGSTGIRITTNRIDFLDGRGEPVAYITNQVMRINRGIFVDSAQIGEHKIETIAGGHTIWTWIPPS